MTIVISAATGLCAAPGPLGLGAASLGQGGAVTAWDGTSESAFWNPAGLRGVTAAELGWQGGHGSATGEFRNALHAAWPVPEFGVLGLSLEDARLKEGGLYRQNRLAALVALPLNAWSSLGMRQNFVSDSPGGLRGWSMDMGLNVDLAGALWNGQGWKLGLTAQDLASAHFSENGADGSLPVLLSAGMGVEPWSEAKISLQLDLLDRPDLGRSSQWRAGAEQKFFGGHLALRAGLMSSLATGNYASTGAGFDFSILGTSWRLDYAVLIPIQPTGSSQQFFRQVAGLTLDFAPLSARLPLARAAQLKSRASQVMPATTIELEGGGSDSRAWELVLRDDQGKIVRSFRGRSPLPESLDWDGKDEDGRSVLSSGVSYSLRVTSEEGLESVRHGVLLGQEKLLENIGMARAVRSDPHFARRSPGVEALRAVDVRPILKSAEGIELAGATFDLSYLATKKVKTWQLKVVDEQGRTIKTFSGRGKPPKSLRWKGETEIGRPMAAAARGGYVLRVTDAAGRQSSEAGDLVRPLILKKDSPVAKPDRKNLAAIAKTLTKCRLNDALDECKCVFHFGFQSHVIVTEDHFDFVAFASLAQAGGFSDLSVRGHTDNLGHGDLNQSISESRANGLVRQLQSLGWKPERVDVVGFGASDPVAVNDSPDGRLQNRRVEVIIRRPYIVAEAAPDKTAERTTP